MKRITLITYCLAALAFGFQSCVSDTIIPNEDSQSVDITISTETRTNGSALYDPLDYSITTLRVLGYRASSGTLAFNELVTSFTITSGAGTSAVKQEAQVNVKTGDFHLVMIANENPGLTGDPRLQTYIGAQQITFARSAFSETGNMPMAAFYDNVTVIGDNSLNVAGTPVNGTWGIGLTRTGIRLDVKLTLNAAQFAKWTTWKTANGGKYLLTVTGIPAWSYLFPNKDNSVAGVSSSAYEAQTGNSSYTLAPGNIVQESSGDYTITFPRIILPEHYFTDTTNSLKSMGLQLSFSDGVVTNTYTGKIGSQIDPASLSPLDYTLPRNSYLWVKATVLDEVELSTESIVVDWEEAALSGIEFY